MTKIKLGNYIFRLDDVVAVEYSGNERVLVYLRGSHVLDIQDNNAGKFFNLWHTDAKDNFDSSEWSKSKDIAEELGIKYR